MGLLGMRRDLKAELQSDHVCPAQALSELHPPDSFPVPHKEKPQNNPIVTNARPREAA